MTTEAPADARVPADAGATDAEDAPSTSPPMTAAAETMVRAQLLKNDETILLLIKPSLWYIPLSCLNSIAVIAAATLLLLIARQHDRVPWASNDIVTCALVLIALRLTWQFLEWLSRIYVLTDRRLFRIKGVVRTIIYEVALEDLADPQLIQRMRESAVGIATLAYARHGAAYFEAYWQMIADATKVGRTVQDAIDRRRQQLGRDEPED